jgi:hypothetical protein
MEFELFAVVRRDDGVGVAVPQVDGHAEVRQGEAPRAPEERRSSRAHLADAVVLDGDYDPASRTRRG